MEALTPKTMTANTAAPIPETNVARLIVVQTTAEKAGKIAAMWFRQAHDNYESTDPQDLRASEKAKQTMDLIEGSQTLDTDEKSFYHFICVDTKRDNLPVGYLAAKANDIYIEVHALFAHPNRQTSEGIKGAGSLLMSSLEHFAGSLGLYQAKVISPYFSAMSFYEQHGYEDEEGYGTELLKENIVQPWKREFIPSVEEEPPRINRAAIVYPWDLKKEMGVRKSTEEGAAFLTRVKCFETAQIFAYYNKDGQSEVFSILDVSDPYTMTLIHLCDFSKKEKNSAKLLTLFEKYAASCQRKLIA